MVIRPLGDQDLPNSPQVHLQIGTELFSNTVSLYEKILSISILL